MRGTRDGEKGTRDETETEEMRCVMRGARCLQSAYCLLPSAYCKPPTACRLPPTISPALARNAATTSAFNSIGIEPAPALLESFSPERDKRSG